MLAVLWLALAAAGDTLPAPRLHLGDVYEAGRMRSPRLAAASALAHAARARVPASRVPPDPEIQVGFMNYSLPGLAPMEPLGMAQIQVMQMIPTAGKLTLAGRATAARAAAAAERAREVEWEVRTQLAMTFYDLHVVDRRLVVMRQTLRVLQDVRTTTEAMYRVGEGRQADVLRAQVEIARMVEDTLRMTSMRVAMAARLNALLDRPADTRVSSPALPAFPETIPALEWLAALAARERPMLRAGERDVDAAGHDASLARRELWPDLTVGVQYGQRGSAMGTERMGSLMLGASLPVFARSRQATMRDELEAMRQMSVADLAEMRARTRGDVAAAHAALTRARNLASLYRTTVIPQAEAAAASAQAAYRVGRVDFMTLLDDRMAVNRYRQELFTLEADEGKAWAELEMLAGRALFAPTTTGGAR